MRHLYGWGVHIQIPANFRCAIWVVATYCYSTPFCTVSKLDREFFSTGVLEVLDELNVTYLMPRTNTKGVVNALNKFAAGKRQKVSENYLKGSG